MCFHRLPLGWHRHKPALVRYASISTSCVCLPLAITALTVQCTKDTPSNFPVTMSWRSMALAHHAADLSLPLLMLVFQLINRPWGMIMVGSVYSLAILTFWMYFKRTDPLVVIIGTCISMPLFTAFSVSEVLTRWSPPEFRGCNYWVLVGLRPFACWLLLLAIGVEAYMRKDVMEQLFEPHVLPIIVLAGVCTFLLPFTTMQQRLGGRWHLKD
eukprot:TRINITY_DN102014_c0_g1_i1.p1 TRINITY_DN102014_c0_g1~~TRINITY_DN102014_c0_g1_i1.p1  ORF type:complete len:213 (+),score=1.15 TRINITY_DN102014_c0_g1_i1:18-656(+)